MLENEAGISLHFPHNGKNARGIGQFLTSVLMFFGICGCLWRVLDLAETGANPFLLLCIGIIYCVVGCGLMGQLKYAFFASLIVPVVFLIAVSAQIIEGWNIAANQVFYTLEVTFGRIFPRFELNAEANQSLCANMFLSLPTILLAATCGRITAGGRAWRFSAALLAAAGWGAAVVFCMNPPLLCAAAIAISTVVILGQRQVGGKGALYSNRMSLCALALAAALTAAAILPALYSRGGDAASADIARRSVSRVIHTARYGAGDSKLPEGNFSNLTNNATAAEPALLVTADTAGHYYLRGFIGEVYVGDGWTKLPASRRAEYATLFSWLHDRDFYAQNQYSLLTSALGASTEKSTFSIENVNACTEYIYVPYEVSAEMLDKNRIGDENIYAGGWRGESEYALAVSAGFVSEHERLYAALVAARRREEPAAIYYLTSENAYRDYVYENYLEIPEDSFVAVKQFFSGLELPQERIAFTDAIMIVNTYLSLLSYHESPAVDYENGDFLKFFLEESRDGNSLYFATAATLMFRYLGIPARYVEGYLFNIDANYDVEASRSGAYAWAEIYRDGVGFVPFELNLPNQVVPNHEIYSPEFDEPAEAEPNPSDAVRGLLHLAVIVLAVLLFLALLCFALLALRRARRLGRLNTLLRTTDNADAIGYTTTRIIQVLSFVDISYENGSLQSLCPVLEDKFGDSIAKRFEAVLHIQQVALFSGHSPDNESRVDVRGFLDEIVSQIKAHSSACRRFHLKWINCIY